LSWVPVASRLELSGLHVPISCPPPFLIILLQLAASYKG